jgi:D-alanyl-D-alanine dipeptidase
MAPSIQFDIKYATVDNLVGRPLDGYQKNICIVTEALGHQLALIQQELALENLALFIFETYRPKRAGTDLKQWANDSDQLGNKADYFPNVDKADFYQQGYIIEHSAHTRGSTVDLTLIDRITGVAIDMGTSFDFMDKLSHPDNLQIGQKAFANRQYLRQLMQRHGFTGIDTEWWHFTLNDEPFPDTYFDFPVV